MQDLQEPVIESVEEILPPSRRVSLMRFARRVTGAQFVRYIVIGTWNTALGYGMFAYFTFLFSKRSVHGYIYASILSNAIGITVAFFGYKLFVFRTKGNYLKEYCRCVMVYGSAAIPGLFFLPIVKNAIVFSTPAAYNTFTIAGHVLYLQKLAPYLAGATITACTVVYSFFGHRKFSFKVAPSQQN
ncbi:MAG TPA: GtrA family protein [Acidobacteriaceae bacterium]|jgi:putative flippase GtrA|nr:GtrA family protein [Acidobacteriaceae bacterium]